MRILALTNFLFTFVLSLCSATTLTDEEIAKILSDTSRPEIPLSNLRDYEHSQQLGNLRDKLRTLDLDIDDQDGGDIFPNEAPDVLEGGAFDSIIMIDRDGKERRYGHGLMNNQRLGLQPIGNVPLVVYNEEGRKIRTDSSSLGYSKRRAGWHNKGRYSGISIARRGTGGRPTRDDIRRDPSPWIPLGYLVTSTPTYGRDLAQRPLQGPNYFPGNEGNANAMEKRWGQKGRFKSIKMQRRDDADGRGLGLDEPSTGGLDVDYLESSMVGNGYYPFGAYSPLEDTLYGPEEANVRPIRHVRPKRAVDDQMDQYNTKRINKRVATNRRGSGFGRAQSQTRWKRADIGEFLNTPNQADEEGRSWNNAGGFGRNHRRSMNVLRAILLRNSSCYIYNTCGYEV